MSVDGVNENVGSEGQDVQKILSLLLFSAVKPHCVELTQIALLPTQIFNSNSPKLLTVLANIDRTLHEHYHTNHGAGAYRLSANIADYIFFPLSNLLKQSSLNEEVISRVLSILAFLILNAWSQNADIQLIDQLYPVVLFLIDDSVAATGLTTIHKKKFAFKQSAIEVMESLIRCLPGDYFSNAKKLAMLGSTTTILLDTFSSLQNPSVQEEIGLVNDCVISIQLLYSKVSPEQLSHVLPGTVSQMVNFMTTSKSMHFTIICGILKLLKELIIKVFNDKDLKASIDVSNLSPDLEKLNELWENQNDDLVVSKVEMVEIKLGTSSSGNEIRSTSWLFATAKQLKISLTILFKSLLTAPGNRLKVQTKSQVSDGIVSFVNEILLNCFISLFKDFCPIALDVLAMVMSILAYDDRNSSEKATEEDRRINEYTSSIIHSISINSTNNQNQSLLYNHVKLKLVDFINNKLSDIIYSTDDEKINSYIVSLKFQFNVLHSLSNHVFIEDNVIQDLKLKLIGQLQDQLINCFAFNIQLKKKESFPLSLSAIQADNTNNSENRLDNIELPPHITAKKLTQVRDGYNTALVNNKNSYTDNLSMLSNNWPKIIKKEDSTYPSSNYFKGIYSSFVEDRLAGLLKYIESLEKPEEGRALTTIETLFLESGNTDTNDFKHYLGRAISLWMANSLLNASNSKNDKVVHEITNANSFDIDEYLVFDEESSDKSTYAHYNDKENDMDEISYLIMGKAQEVIDEVSVLMNSPEQITTKNAVQLHRVYDFAYSVALDSMGQISKYLPLSDFQTDFLIDYLYPLLEALSYQSNSMVQGHASAALNLIVQNYYNGSLESLIVDNLDYLVDCLSLKLSIVSTLTPALPGILLIVLKIAGLKLLLSNQLLDILTKIFILVDSYHGYSALIEGFFIVFEELVKQIKNEYLKSDSLNEKEITSNHNNSLYSPWGLTSCEQLLTLISDSHKLIDPMNEYDSSKEYFKRKPETPFENQLVDSDDEDNEDSESIKDEESPELVWDCSIPKNIYFIVQKMFNYGFRLLSHPSTNLRIQILKTLISIFPILCENFPLVLPVLSQHWPVLLTLITGSSTLSSHMGNQSEEYMSDNLTIFALDFVIDIINRDDDKGGKFLAKRFVEVWEQLSSHSKISTYISRSNSSRANKSSSTEVALSRTALNPKLNQAYTEFIITGLNIYERTVSDPMAYDMVKFCYKMGLSKDYRMSREVQNILWVIKQEAKI